jgi:hypothetical protein
MHFDERYFSQMIDANYQWKNEVKFFIRRQQGTLTEGEGSVSYPPH